jgi:CRISPR-associated protein Cas2
MQIIITYDIADTKNRTKVAALLEGFGLRVNYSVFEIDIKRYKLATLLEQIKTFCDAEDSVRIYVMNKESIGKSFELMNRSKPFEKTSGYVD